MFRLCGPPETEIFPVVQAIATANRGRIFLFASFAPTRPVDKCTEFVRSADQGKTFERISFIGTDHTLCEPTIAESPDGRLVALARRQGDISFSDDGGNFAADARTAALWGLRIRVSDTAHGIEILPAPGSPAAEGKNGNGCGVYRRFT